MAQFPFFKSLTEKYSDDNRHFLNYMKAGNEFDPFQSWYYVCQWCEQNDYLDEVSEIVGEELTSAQDMEEHEPDVFYKLPPEIQKECGEWAVERHAVDDPSDAPTSHHMSLNKPQLLPRTTWLAHFTDKPWDVAREGFTKGVDRMDRLGLTTWLGDHDKDYGGYNFAFVADSRHAAWAASQGKYGGKGVLLFQNSGVHCYHYGDEEDQVVFWGADVSPKEIVLVTKEYDEWQVQGNHDLGGERGNVVYKDESFEKVVKWVMQNHRQYAKHLYTR